ncbi:hypothetical protein BFP70_10785 [Thioclava sp. SK-1]|uniref:FliM/FliN family flagellar motor switch protein n=1 Tax=Thioclava sp. SK-1 TaxID=1889770 RepID=UPI000826FC74|nr:FliM/FliN family flagellar motor C-terminal domain-containing protein [Thioclava sp. SK-1]OCX64518.1 hypothetical protein BFP70_10785 [Thioclava sp. SK-1]
MVDEQAISILRRKTAAAAADGAGVVVTVERALRSVLAKVAQDMLELPLQVEDVKQVKKSLAEMLEGVEEMSMLCVVEGPQEGLGMVALPTTTYSALIEILTMGQLAKVAPSPRRPTRVDATMVQEFLDNVLEGMERLLLESDDIIWAGGFRYASFLDDPRPLSLILDDISYRCVEVTMRVGPGLLRDISMTMCLPAAGRGEKPAPSVVVPKHGTDPNWTQNMERTVMSTRAELMAVLHRWSMPLGDAMGLTPGMEIPIPSDALETLKIEGAGRRRMAIARLGQHSGRRAVRILEDDAEDALNDAEPDHSSFDAGASPFGGMAPMDEEGAAAGFGGFDDIEAAPAEMDLGGLSDDGEMPTMGLPMGGFEDDEDMPAMKTA